MSKKASSAGLQKSAPGAPLDVAAPKMGVHASNAAAVVQLLRIVAGTYYVTAQQVDILTEILDELKSKVRPRAV